MEQERVDFEKWEEFWLVSTLSPMAGQVGWYRHHSGKEKCGALERYVGRCTGALGCWESSLGRRRAGICFERGYSSVDIHFIPWVKECEYAGLSLEKISAHAEVN